MTLILLETNLLLVFCKCITQLIEISCIHCQSDCMFVHLLCSWYELCLGMWFSIENRVNTLRFSMVDLKLNSQKRQNFSENSFWRFLMKRYKKWFRYFLWVSESFFVFFSSEMVKKSQKFCLFLGIKFGVNQWPCFDRKCVLCTI